MARSSSARGGSSRGGRGPDARTVATRVLMRVESDAAYATLALTSELDRAKLSDADRRLATELCYGVLRHRDRLDRALSARSHKGIKKAPPFVRMTMRVAAYQMLFLDRIPTRAAINEAVSAIRRQGGQRLAGFANGLLRALDREGEEPLPSDDSLESMALRSSVPLWVLELIGERTGLEGRELEEVAQGFAGAAPMSARWNVRACSYEELLERLEAEGARIEESELRPGALRLRGVGSPATSWSFSEGLWTVQDEAAQVVSDMLQLEVDRAKVLDLCAGVGGKTTHVAELYPEASIDAVDINERKLELLQKSCERLGIESIRPLCIDGRQEDERLARDYDAVILDAPCTGLGVLRRHPERKWHESGVDVGALVELQRELLDCAVARLRPGGVLLYSVCSFTEAEGPAQVRALLERHPSMQLEAPEERAGGPSWNELLSEEGFFEAWPHRGGWDGFFAARLRKKR